MLCQRKLAWRIMNALEEVGGLGTIDIISVILVPIVL